MLLYEAMMRRDLIYKYNVPGPRYTSYPTVPYWDHSPTPHEWIKSIQSALKTEQYRSHGASLYVHIPFCESLCTYCGCNTRITRRRDVGLPYVKTVLKEWQLYLDQLEIKKLNLGELHLGGGTPTFLEPSDLSLLIDGIFTSCDRTLESELSLEAHPGVTRKEHLEALALRGFKRLSLGIQDFDPKIQEIVNRKQTFEQVKDVTKTARKLGFTSISYDLIYGLPLQTLESVRFTMDLVKRLRPDRIAYFSYAHVPWLKPSQRKFTEADLPQDDLKRELYETGRGLLEEAGYREIGMDHFSLETDTLWEASQAGTLHRNFMGYTSRSVFPLIGLGVSAIGDSWNLFAQNEKKIETYLERVEKGELPLLRGHVLTEEDRVLRRNILGLMTRFETSWADSKEPCFTQIQKHLEEMHKDGLVKIDKSNCLITPEGRPFLRNICMAFDARLNRKAPETKLFSKTV